MYASLVAFVLGVIALLEGQLGAAIWLLIGGIIIDVLVRPWE